MRATRHAYNLRMNEVAAWKARLLAWSLPAILVVYLVATEGKGYLGLPYWLCLGAPTIALFGPWLIFAVARGDDRNGPAHGAGRAFVAISSTVCVAAIGLAIGLRLIHVETIRTVILVAFVAVGSGLVGADLFQKVVFGALVDAKRDAQIVAWLTAAPDHPVSLTFPEGAYLKGLLCRVW